MFLYVEVRAGVFADACDHAGNLPDGRFGVCNQGGISKPLTPRYQTGNKAGMKARKLPELVAYRRKHKLTRAAFARQIGVSRITVWRWEEGKQFPDDKYQPQLAQTLEISMPALLGFGEHA